MSIEQLGYLSVGSQLRRIYEKLQIEGDKVYARIHLTFKSSWFPIYYTLAQSNRALTIMEITENISYSRITVKNVVRELEEVGYVAIKPNPTDSRSKIVQLTAKGELVRPDLQLIWNSFQEELTAVFGKNGAAFLSELTRINQSLSTKPMGNEVLKKYYNFTVRNARADEFEEIGAIMVAVYAVLKGFPKQDEQPQYYELLRNVGQLTANKNIELLVAVSEQGKIGGAVVYFNDMKDYGSGGTATQEKNACGFRLLAVSEEMRGLGIGKLLTAYCIQKGKDSSAENMVIHTTSSMKLAWGMYERLGFKRAEDLDFMQENLPVFGFRLNLR